MRKAGISLLSFQFLLGWLAFQPFLDVYGSFRICLPGSLDEIYL